MGSSKGTLKIITDILQELRRHRRSYRERGQEDHYYILVGKYISSTPGVGKHRNRTRGRGGSVPVEQGT